MTGTIIRSLSGRAKTSGLALGLLLVATTAVFARSTAPLAVAPATAALPSAFEGVWQGSYLCGQGRTGLRLTIRHGSGKALEGEFAFFTHSDNPGVPSGRFRMKGAVVGQGFTMAGTEWLDRPYGYRMVGVEAPRGPQGNRLSGRIIDPNCWGFEVEKE